MWLYAMCMMRANEARSWLRYDEERYWLARADEALTAAK